MAVSKYKRKNNYNNYLKRYKYISPMIGAASRLMTSTPWSRTATSTARRPTSSGGGVTNQYDRKVVYQKRRMPRRRRRQWGKFVRKVDAALLKKLGTHTNVINGTSNIQLTGTYGTQGYSVVHLYGKNGSFVLNPLFPNVNETGTGDIRQLTQVNPANNNNYSKILMKSAHLDVTFRNNGEVMLEVDAYDIIYFNIDKLDKKCFIDCVSECEANTPGSMTMLDRGVTLFDYPLLSRNGMKILKKIKYLLGPNEAATYQCKDSRNHVIDTFKVIPETDEFLYKGLTRTVVLVAKPVVYSGEFTWALTVGSTRSYKYTWLEDNKVGENYVIS